MSASSLNEICASTAAHLEHTKINGVMTENPITVSPATTLEEATKILLERQVGGLPVVADGRLIGIITASDILNAFLDVMGASHGGSTRIDLILEGEEHGFVEATRIVAREGGEVLGIGTYREKPRRRSGLLLASDLRDA